jgi:putative sigma-54 modulation protein
MKINYTGVQELNPVQKKKIEDKFNKLSKLFDRKGEKEAHVVITNERHLHHAEVTVNFHDHALVSIASNADLFLAATTAVEKLEKQALKLQTKWRDTKRGPKQEWKEPEAEAAPAAVVAGSNNKSKTAAKPARKVFRVNWQESPKPMTLDEALLEMEKEEHYLVYRDAETDCLSVLVRRRDGNFDLIEA